jgi:predicted RNase H-like nuclease
MMFFVGIDLAWSTKNGTGICVVGGNEEHGVVLSHKIVYSDSEILDFVNNAVSDNPALLAIDAPLTVPNESGRKVAEEVVGKLFRKYDAGAHPANRKRLSSWDGKIRGEELSRVLLKADFAHDPYVKKFESGRKFFEVYPHPSMVVLFGLDRILRYKAKSHRDYEFRWSVFETYQQHLAHLKSAQPALDIPDTVLKANVRELRGQKLKDYEDDLDGIFCAYIAHYYWCHPEACEVLGSTTDGYIMTPITDAMRIALKSCQNQKKVG